MCTCMRSTQLRTWALVRTVGQVFLFIFKNNIYSLNLFKKLETYVSKELQDFCTDKRGTCVHNERTSRKTDNNNNSNNNNNKVNK